MGLHPMPYKLHPNNKKKENKFRKIDLEKTAKNSRVKEGEKRVKI